MTSLILKNRRILVSCNHLVTDIAIKLSEAKLVLITMHYVIKSRNAIHNVNYVYFLCTMYLKCNLLRSVIKNLIQTQTIVQYSKHSISETGSAIVLCGKMFSYPCNKQEEFDKNSLQCSLLERGILFPRSILSNMLLLRTVCPALLYPYTNIDLIANFSRLTHFHSQNYGLHFVQNVNQFIQNSLSVTRLNE